MSKIKNVLVSLSGILLSANITLAESINSTTSHLGAASGVANDLVSYAKWIAIIVAVLSLLALWISGNLARFSNKINEAIKSREGLKNWFIETILVIFAFIFLFSYVIPQLNNFV